MPYFGFFFSITAETKQETELIFDTIINVNFYRRSSNTNIQNFFFARLKFI